MNLLESFRQVGQDGVSERGLTFWSWDDDPAPEEIRRQIREMNRIGLGGIILPARSEFHDPSVLVRWKEAFRTALDECRTFGLEAWLTFDTERPNEPNGGERSSDPASRQKWIVVQEVAPEFFTPPERCIALFVATKTTGGWTDLQRVPDPESAAGIALSRPGSSIMAFTFAVGDSPDLLDPVAVRGFLDAEAAWIESGSTPFDPSVTGIYGPISGWRSLPWSDGLPAAYRKDFDEELADLLPSLFFPIGDWRRARYRFWSAATRLLLHSFVKPLGVWCRERGWVLAGHLKGEGRLEHQIRSIGGAMPLLAAMEMPAVDSSDRLLNDPLLEKQAASVGRQLGKRVLSGMFGGSDQDEGLEEWKAGAERQFVLGVERFAARPAQYRLRGGDEELSSLSMSYQQPAWPDFRRLTDRCARLLHLLRGGQRVADILLIHPIGSAWAIHDPNDEGPVQAMDRHFVGISRFLLEIGRDHDFGDEWILESHARVEGGRLIVGEAVYSVIVVPPVVTLQGSTARLLRDFHAAGGKIVLVGSGPERLDGEAGSEAERFREWLTGAAGVCPDDEPDALESALFAAGWPRVQIKDGNGEHASELLVQQRDLGSRQVYFFVHTGREHSLRADIALQGTGSVQEWDPDTGSVSLVPVRQALGNTAFRLDFEPLQSRLIVLDHEAEPWIGFPVRTSDVGIFYGEEEWELTLLSPNALVLDTARCRFPGEEWSDPHPLRRFQEERSRHPEASEWTLEFRFENRMKDLSGPLHLVIERPEAVEIALNGQVIPSLDEGWWVDLGFRKIPISGKLQPGLNTLVLTRRSGTGSEETGDAVHLIGGFGVEASGRPEKGEPGSDWLSGPFALVDPPARVSTGDLSVQGFPFFRGTLAIEQEIWIPERPGDDVRAVLELETIHASVTRVIVNDREVGKIAWRPYRLDVTDFVPEGENIRLRLELTGTCRNLLGPHHRSRETQPEDGTDPGGGLSPTRRDDYNVVNFGIAGDVLVLFEAPKEGGPAEDLVRRQCG